MYPNLHESNGSTVVPRMEIVSLKVPKAAADERIATFHTPTGGKSCLPHGMLSLLVRKLSCLLGCVVAVASCAGKVLLAREK